MLPKPTTALRTQRETTADQATDGRCEKYINATTAISPLSADGVEVQPERDSDVVRRAISYLDANFMEPVTLRDLESITTCNIYKIIRVFRDYLGTTPHAYLMRLRVERATALLITGEPIIGAAAEAGFFDQSHFTRHFKREYGTTPGEFARRFAAGDVPF
jgi:AraC-like DNA-binding protein